LFHEGGIPPFREFEGETRGSFLAWNPQNSWLQRLSIKLIFDSFFARWTGKKFLTSFKGEERGRGINLYNNLILLHRFRFDTYIKEAYSDGKPCLALDYGTYPSLMFGLVDDVRKIQDGVLLGQMYYKYPWRKERWFWGYFTLCTLSK